MKAQHQGFTLVELAVVLLIIGLLMGGMLKGQSLLESARVKNLAQDFRSLPALVHAYQDRYRAFPGDDHRASLHLCGATACTTPGNGDGTLDGSWDDDGNSETFYFWQHVRLAGLATGSSDPANESYLPLNALGGRLGVQRAGSLLGISGDFLVCSGGIPGRLVRQLDQALDDGDPSTGSLRAGSSAGNSLDLVASAAAIDDDVAYTVCASL